MAEMTLETPQQREARIHHARFIRALNNAPDVAAHVRSIAISGATERGETLPEWTAPMRIQAADDVDDLFAQLLNWVTYWGHAVKQPLPVNQRAFWHGPNEPQGFRPSTTAVEVHRLVQSLTGWLIARNVQLKHDPTWKVYADDVISFTEALDRRYPRAERKKRIQSARPCPVCDQQAVYVEWVSPTSGDALVRCAECMTEFDADPWRELMLKELSVV
jgi:hypothetical protein